MGRYSNSNFGDISGKVGNAIGSNWRGIKYMRTPSSKGRKPATEGQLAIQARFALAAAQLGPIKDVLNLGFNDKKLNKVTGYNAAVSLFLAEAITGTYPNYAVDYSKIKMSKGSLYPEEITVSLETEINLSWQADLTVLNASASDKMVFVIYNQTKNTYRLNNHYGREYPNVSIPYPGKPGDVFHIWSFCVRFDGKTASPSKYVGEFTVPV